VDQRCKLAVNFFDVAIANADGAKLDSIREFVLAKAYRGQLRESQIDWAVRDMAREDRDTPGKRMAIEYGFLRDGRMAFHIVNTSNEVPDINKVMVIGTNMVAPIDVTTEAPEMARGDNDRVFVLDARRASFVLASAQSDDSKIGRLQYAIDRPDGGEDSVIFDFDKGNVAVRLQEAFTYATAPELEVKP
jgi:hypothetical protein